MALAIAMFAIFGIAAGFFGIWAWMRRISKETDQRMQTSFQSLSYEVMERSNKMFLDLAQASFEKARESANSDLEARQKSFEALVQPLQESLKKLDTHQRDLETRREGAYGSLAKQIEQMAQAERDLRKETAQLSSALRSPPVQGAWGQVHLRRVVELAGLLNECDFAEQMTTMSEGKVIRPDLIIRLPGNRQIAVDAKTPLNAYIESMETKDEGLRDLKVKAHAEHLRKHIRQLSQKEYWKGFDASPEFVVLFLPAESFLSVALQADPLLIENGAEQNVIVATPSTLIAILRAVAHSWRQDVLSKNAEQIARLGQDLYERLTILGEHWMKVGRSLNTAVDSYNQAISSFESRVMVSARKLKEHGAAPLTKEIAQIDPVDKLART